ncbi:MAG TPA: MFS transporter [Solirubrobacteraceae bacterium]|nr:MFS transporter [Solirubrobacteraceae bacterium]
MDVAALTPVRQRLLIAAVMSGLLLAMLDQTIVGTALPRIVEQLGGQDLYLWVVTVYLVPATVSLPIYARMSDRHGRRPLLLIGMTLFLGGSALSAVAGSMEQLIAWRGMQGLGAGALEGLSFILVADLFRGQRNAALQGAMAGLMGFSFIAGPLVGGLLTDQVGWRWCFLVNLPIGIAAMVVVGRVLPASVGRSERRGAPVDLLGIALLTGAVGLLLVGLSERTHAAADGTLPAWAELRTGGLIVAGLLLLVAFVVAERRAASPIVPLALFSDRRTAALLAAGAAGTFGLFAGVLLLPRYFQLVRDVSATHSGLLVYPLLLGIIVSANVAGIVISRRLEFRRPVLVGLALASLGALGFATFDASTPDWASLLFMGLMGVGLGPMLSGLQIATMRTVTPAMIGAALGTLLLLRQVGGSIALASSESVYAAGLHGDAAANAATATGTGVFAITLTGAAIAAIAMLSLPRGGGRLPPLPAGPPAQAAAPAPQPAAT